MPLLRGIKAVLFYAVPPLWETTMTKDEALRLAWDALEDIGDEWGFTSQRTVPKRKEALTAIKEALAQPEQEPVGEIVDAIEGAFKCSFTKMLPVGTKLYTTPPQRTWVGLTDEDRFELAKAQYGWEDLLFAAEAKLKEKNT
jgi:hypothetical protein